MAIKTKPNPFTIEALGDGISWRINFALERKYGDRIPNLKWQRAEWVANRYDSNKNTTLEWLCKNRKPRAAYLTRIAVDTGVDKDWLMYGHGGSNPYENTPYEPLEKKVDTVQKMETYALLHSLRQQYGFSFTDGEMLEMAAVTLTRLRLNLKQHKLPLDMANESALVFARLLNELALWANQETE